MTTTDIRYATRDGVALVTFDRPAALNAIRSTTRDELDQILDAAEADPAVKVVVLTGNGRAFSAGHDLKELADSLEAPAYASDDSESPLDRLQALTRRLVSYPKPTIAALNGVAVGLGAELALACDLRIASETATIGFVEVKRGLFETNGVMYLLPRVVGYGRAMQLLLTGDLIPAHEADRIGLVNRVVPADQLRAAALTLAAGIAGNAPTSVRLVKDVLRQTYDHDLDGVMRLEAEGMLTCAATDDIKEGTRAFLEKRPPLFTGR